MSFASPKTSIITLTHERPEYLAEAIASVEAQTDTDWEHLVYDDFSYDPRVLEVLEAAKARNPDKFFFWTPVERGPLNVVGYYWNLLIDHAFGRYITVLDDDNRKLPDFLEKMTAPLDADEKLCASTCSWRYINAAGEAYKDVHLNMTTSMENLCRDNTIDSNALLFRKSVVDKIGKYDPALTTNEDWDFNIRLIRKCNVRHLSSVHVDYRVHDKARSREAISKLGAHANWDTIRRRHFSDEERMNALGYL